MKMHVRFFEILKFPLLPHLVVNGFFSDVRVKVRIGETDVNFIEVQDVFRARVFGYVHGISFGHEIPELQDLGRRPTSKRCIIPYVTFPKQNAVDNNCSRKVKIEAHGAHMCPRAASFGMHYVLSTTIIQRVSWPDSLFRFVFSHARAFQKSNAAFV